MFFQRKPTSIYLDHASATPVLPETVRLMQPYFGSQFGNPGSIHDKGIEASVALESSRADLAKALRVRSECIFFTGNGTESNNIALRGLIAKLHAEGRSYSDMEIIAPETEHASVQETLGYLEKEGVVIHSAPVNSDGMIVLEAFTALLTPKTVLVTTAYVNSEIGVIQPIQRMSRVINAFEEKEGVRVYFHVDGAQAPLWLPCELDALGADMLSLDAGKCYGPKGVGVLVLRHNVPRASILFGGSQEGGLRPGTENVPLIVGAVHAFVSAIQNHVIKAPEIALLRDRFIAELETIQGVILNGSRTHRVANNVNISIPGIDSEYAVVTLNEHHIYAGTKSACGGAKGDGSSVVRHISNDEARARSTIRFTLGYDTSLSELQKTVAVLKDHIAHMRSAQASLTA